MNDVTKRLQIVLKRVGLNQKEFAKGLGISPSSLSQMLNGKQGVSERFLNAFHSKYPKIRIEWLMFENGEMFEEGINETLETFFGEELGGDANIDAAKDTDKDTAVSPQPTVTESVSQPVEIVYRDRPVRQITEIRVYFSDDTFEIFAHKK